jgi:hypothetical protein
MDEELEVLKQYVESLGLHEKSGLTTDDVSNLRNDLLESDESSLANYVTALKTPAALEDFIVNTLYG